MIRYPLGGNPVGPWLDALGLTMYRPVFKLGKVGQMIAITTEIWLLSPTEMPCR